MSSSKFKGDNLVRFAVFTLLFGSILSGCPDQFLLYPCTCHHSIFGTHVYCGGDSHINMENIFESLSTGLVSDKKHFTHLTIANSAIRQINENIFRDITFESILIENCLNLTKIHRNAFSETNWFTKSFAIKNCPQFETNRDDFFYSMSKFKNIETLDILDTNISEIPSNAFKPINGFQNNLKTINIKGRNFGRIGNNSFRYLNSLTDQSFINTSIALIPDYAFHFSRFSRNKIVINFIENHFLNESSFAKNCLALTLRPTQIIGIPANILQEEVFLSFLTSNEQNLIEISNRTELECNDCRNFWLRRDSELSSRVTGIQCSNGLNLKDNNNFIHCNH